ncbi:adenosylmethionine--8-amino-7-oxononanoate transaminase [Lignipirellula cremea]|uniref:Adenosylmethionine-8-amino-7-oxononanoate aminotransferase n=1 Tax=Lignipirellula cremea TaxID=2528010 RepID=A0A518E2H7_9BACT|nr:adenosylmethionine--8-amino-7-oxononanoate transaminase [Lignipirellula cremea]QDU98295.1 L-Lysine-8-amino-7-oxononanoate aminotransferase [Lignipirellula cremea]
MSISQAGSAAPSHEELRRWDRERVWHPFTQMAEYEPFIIERAEGCTLIDIDGRRLLDGVSSLWCNLHGHCRPEIDEAIKTQLEKTAHVTALGQSNPTTIQLAQRLTTLAPDGLTRAYFSDDGSTAVEVALKMAFQYWQQRSDPRPRKQKYVAFANAYHGDTLGSVSVGGVARFHAMFHPLLFEVLRAPSPDTYRRPPGVSREQACEYYLAQLETLLADNADEIAALVIEPLLQAAAGMVRHPEGFLRGVRELTKRYDVLLIADEVAVGCGRTGTMFACEQEQVSPDFLCLAKGLTGGYLPLAATLTTDEVWNAFLGTYAESKSFFHGHTYCGNPLGAAAALASLRIFEQDRTLEQMQPKIARLSAHLARMAEHPHVGDVRQCGLIGAVELVRDKATAEPFPWDEKRGMRVCDYALTQGVWLRPLGNVLVILPPLAIQLEELDQICHAVEQGIAATI